jgi:hypothetical protein
VDGALERLVHLLHDFCICLPPLENPAILFGLSPPNLKPLKLVPTLNPTSFDKHAAYRFSLAWQCVVDIGVRGSEAIRSRVVQAGTLDVVLVNVLNIRFGQSGQREDLDVRFLFTGKHSHCSLTLVLSIGLLHLGVQM